MSCLDDIGLGASRSYAKEANCVEDAHRLDILVFVNHEANSASSTMTAFHIASVVVGDFSALSTNRRESDGETKYADEVNSSRSLFAYRKPQLLSLLDCKIADDENVSCFVEGDSHTDAFSE